MVYRNFIYFIVAIAIFVVAPSSQNSLFPLFQDLAIVFVLILLFSHHVRNSFFGLRRKYSKIGFDSGNFRVDYRKKIDISLLKAVILFGIEIYLFDIKVMVIRIFRPGGIEIISDLVILVIFFIHFAIVWYWGYKFAGDIIFLSGKVIRYITDNIKFNLAIVIPWLLLTLITDLLRVLNIGWIWGNSDSVIFQFAFLVVFLLIFSILGPVLIVRLWNCKPLEAGSLRQSIEEFATKQGVSYKKILSWNSLNGSLVTAGVIGFFRKFRYLMLTPELIHMLSVKEIIAVVSHETGHVKRKHLLYYMILFVGFIVFSGGFISVINLIVLSSPFGADLLIGSYNILGVSVFNLVMGLMSVLVFIVYFRFIFGYFMRNFEREADIFCFDTDSDPEDLISSFRKLGVGIKEKKGSNWHHYSIDERIDFLEKCIRDKSQIKKHRKKIKRNFYLYLITTGLVLFLTFNPIVKTFSSNVKRKVVISAIEKKIGESPSDYRLYALAASIYHEMESWVRAIDYYERSLSLNYNQPETLNNLAWLLLTCEDESFRDFKRGLKLAKSAALLRKESHIYDTLAEALLLNGKYEDAVKASAIALEMASANLDYYKNQLKRMKKYLKLSGPTFRL